MKLCSPFLAAIGISSALLLVSCGGGPFYSYSNVTLVISPRIATIAVNGTQTFTATVTNAPPTPVWSVLYGSGVPTDSSYSGSFVTGTETSPTGVYTAPASPPIYTAVPFTDQSQGTVTVLATADASPDSVRVPKSASDSVTFQVIGPVSVRVSPATASVPLGATVQFDGFSVGSTNRAITWQVNGVAGGGTATGVITSNGLYTAPAAMPVTGSTVTITVVSQADTTKSAAAVVTLTSS
jgi:hypothetical protein